MSFVHNHLRTAELIIRAYDGAMPLHHYLKQLFAADKKYGSKDRKAITHACYCFYRLGRALQNEAIADRIKIGLFLCNNVAGTWSDVFEEDWLDVWNSSLDEKIALVNARFPFDLNDVFSFAAHLGESIDKQSFITSHFIQPDLHLRIRPGKEKVVSEKLLQAGIPYEGCGDACVALANATKIDQVLALNKDVVVQDLSSQRIGEMLNEIKPRPSAINTWDCCAASGGKSILAVDILKHVKLTVSDIRSSIIQNLKKRFEEAGVKNYSAFVADIAAPKSKLPHAEYDLVICDAPCSGSGTWSRSPEQLHFFSAEKIGYYSSLQRKIVDNIIPAIKKDGYLLYITCSVFKEENEAVVDFIVNNSSLQVLRMETFKGYDKKADTMFAALFTASPL